MCTTITKIFLTSRYSMVLQIPFETNVCIESCPHGWFVIFSRFPFETGWKTSLFKLVCMKYRAKKCIFDPCFMLYVPDLLLWKVHLACIPVISTGTPRKSLCKQIIQQLECNRIKNPNWHWRQPLKLLTIKAVTKNKSGKWPQQDPNQALLDCNLSDVVPYSASHFLLSMA